MAGPAPSDEYAEFVEGIVELEDVQRQRDQSHSAFEGLLGRLTGSGRVDVRFSLLTGAGMLLLAAALVALLPSQQAASDSFWRVGRHLCAQLLSVGNSLALPLALGAVILMGLALVATARDGQFRRGVLVAQPIVGGAGVVGAGALWGTFLALAFVNFVVLLLIIVAYVVATILVLWFCLGLLMGMMN